MIRRRTDWALLGIVGASLAGCAGFSWAWSNARAERDIALSTLEAVLSRQERVAGVAEAVATATSSALLAFHRAPAIEAQARGEPDNIGEAPIAFVIATATPRPVATTPAIIVGSASQALASARGPTP